MKPVFCLSVLFLFCFSSVNVTILFYCETGNYLALNNSCEENDQDTQLVNSLFKAAEFDDLESVKKILESNKGFIYGMRNHLTVLHVAVIGESLNVIQYLVKERHFNINAIPDNFDFGLSPLGEAAKAGKEKAFKLLIELGADKKKISLFNQNSLLHLAAEGGSVEICKLLLHTFDVNVRNEDLGETPAYIAADKGNLDALRFLLENGADPYAKADDETTMMHAAVISGQVDVVRELARYKGLLTIADGPTSNVSYQSVWYGIPINIVSNMEVVKALVDAGSNVTDDSIWNYISADKLDIVKYLVEKSGKVNVPNIPCNGSLLTHFLETKKYDMIEFLLKRGADVHTKDCKNKTVLHIALESYSKEEDIIVSFSQWEDIIESNSKEKYIHESDSKEEDALAVVKLLLDRGADAVVNVRDVNGLTALDYAKQRHFYKVDEYLRKFGATTYPSQH